MKIKLIAYTNVNFGDDMFIKTICEYFPNCSFVIDAPKKYKKIFCDVPNLEIKKQNVLLSYAKKIIRKLKINVKSNKDKENKIIVYVAGSIFEYNDIWVKSIKEYGLDVFKKILWNNSIEKSDYFLLLGCNITGNVCNIYRKQMEYMFDGLYDICFRDTHSYNNFKYLKNVRYAPDIVFNYRLEKVYETENIIVISIWGILLKTNKYKQWRHKKEKWNRYEDLIVNVINEFTKINKKVVLLSLCKNEGDFEACKIIKQKVNDDKNISIINYNGDLERIISVFAKADYIIGTRFHSIVMAMNLNKNFFPIIYEDKTTNLLNDVYYNGDRLFIDTIKKKDSSRIISSFNKRINYKINITSNVQNQFSKLKKLLDSIL